MQKVKVLFKCVVKKILLGFARLFRVEAPLRAAYSGYKGWKNGKSYQIAKKKQEEIWAEHIREKVNSIMTFLDNLVILSGKKLVYIFQYSYFTSDGQCYISGGGERYATDLSYIIDELGYQPVLIQQGKAEDSSPWMQSYAKNVVVGLNCSQEEYVSVIQNLMPVYFHIYSGFVDFGDKKLSPNLTISHGITWDHPLSNANCEWLSKVIFSTQKLISVDTSTICFLRSLFSFDLAHNPIPMVYIPNYADLDCYFPLQRNNDETIRIVFPRRSAPERGFWLIVEILPDILQKYPQIEFQFIGFVHTSEIKNSIESLKERFPDQVLQRLVKPEDMPSAYQNADITLIPTLYSEGTSLSCIEAMACGNAIIATDIGGLPNLVINDFNGLLIPPTADALYKAIVTLVENPEIRDKFRTNAYNVSQAFSKRKWEERWRSVLQDVL